MNSDREQLSNGANEAYLVGLFRKVTSEQETYIDQRAWLQHLSHLTATYDGPSVMRPDLRLKLALEAAKSGSIRATAKKFSVDSNSIKSALRDAAASLIYLSGYHNGQDVDGKVWHRVDRLKEAEKTLKAAAEVRNYPSVRPLFDKVPHARNLIDAYLTWGTARYELEDAGVTKYTMYQLRSVERFLLEADPEAALDGLTTLARRYVVGCWLSGKEAYRLWADKGLSDAAVFIFQNQNPGGTNNRKNDTVRDIRLFLTEIMFQEFDYVVGKAAPGDSDSRQFFPNADGNPAKKREEIDTPGAYSRFSQAGFCPIPLRRYGQLVRDEVPQTERIKLLRPGEFYSDRWKSNLDWAGVKFMENVLLRPRTVNFKVENLIQNTGDVLKTIKLETSKVG